MCRFQLFTWFDSGYIFPPVYGGPGTRILRSIVLLFVPVYSALLGSTVDTNFASVYGEFHVFYVNWWTTDPEVDSRLSGHRILRTWNADIISLPLVSGSHLFVQFA